MAELADLCTKLKEFNGAGTYALAVRGSRNWATIHPGYMTPLPPTAHRTSWSKATSSFPSKFS
jgi:hypothetical protein